MNEQLFAAQNTQDSSDFYPEDEKTTSAANAEAKENQCAAADAEEISEIETGCSIKDMVAIDVCRSEKTEEHEPGQAADKTSATDESPEAEMMLRRKTVYLKKLKTRLLKKQQKPKKTMCRSIKPR